MGSRRRATLGSALSLAIAATQVASAQAGLRLEVDVIERSRASRPPERWIVWIDGTRVAAEPARRDAGPPPRRVIFRGAEDVAWLVDPTQRSYFQLDPRSSEATASQLASLRDGVEQGLELLSPEQREGVRELLGDLASAPPAPRAPVRLRSRGEPARHAGIACTRHDVLEGERRVAELCLAAWETGPLARDAAVAVPALVSFLRRTLSPLAHEVPSLRPLASLASVARLEGFPLAARSVAPGGPGGDVVAVRVEPHAVDASRFELPAGYSRSFVPPFE